jgi:hypothetical protein
VRVCVCGKSLCICENHVKLLSTLRRKYLRVSERLAMGHCDKQGHVECVDTKNCFENSFNHTPVLVFFRSHTQAFPPPTNIYVRSQSLSQAQSYYWALKFLNDRVMAETE